MAVPTLTSTAAIPAEPAERQGYTRWALVVAGLTGALEALAWLTGGMWLHVLAVLALATLVAAGIELPKVDGLRVVMDAPRHATVGDEVVHRFTVANAGRRRSSPAHLRSHAHGFEDVSALLPSLAPGERVEVEMRRRATSRISAAGSVIALSSSAPLGLRWVTALATVSAPLVVRPAPSRAVALPLEPGPVTADAGLPVVRRDGDQLHGVREWRSGDDARQIHWRTTARRGTLAVLERESLQQPRVVLLVVGPSEDPTFESWVAVVAASALHALQHGAAVSLVAAQHGLPDLVDTDAEAALDWTAALADVTLPDASVVRLAMQAAGPGGTVALLGPGAATMDRAPFEAAAREFGVRAEVAEVRP